jgi:cell division protein FtsQ
MPRLNLQRPARRRPVRFAWLKRKYVTIAGSCLVGLGALVGGAIWLDRADVAGRIAATGGELRQQALRTTARAGLGVRTITVTGREQTRAAEIVAALGVREGAPLLGFDTAAARTELERLPWIRSAAVERRFPDTVLVRLTERQPMALWQTQGRFAVVDTEGKEIGKVDPGAFRHLVVVVGEDAPRHTQGLLALLAAEPDLKKHVTAAIRVAGRRWDLVLTNDIRVQLPEQEIGAAWQKLADAARRERLLDRAISQIDLRAPDRMTLRVMAAADPAPPPASPAARPRAAIRAN